MRATTPNPWRTTPPWTLRTRGCTGSLAAPRRWTLRTRPCTGRTRLPRRQALPWTLRTRSYTGDRCPYQVRRRGVLRPVSDRPFVANYELLCARKHTLLQARPVQRMMCCHAHPAGDGTAASNSLNAAEQRVQPDPSAVRVQDQSGNQAQLQQQLVQQQPLSQSITAAPRLLLPDPRLAATGAGRTHSPAPQPNPLAHRPADPRSRLADAVGVAPPTDPRRATLPPMAANAHPADPRKQPPDPRLHSVSAPRPPPGEPVPTPDSQVAQTYPVLDPRSRHPPPPSADAPSDPRQRRQQPGLPVPLVGTQQPPPQQQPLGQPHSVGPPVRPMVSAAAQRPRPPPGAPPQGLPSQQSSIARPGTPVAMDQFAGQQEQQQLRPQLVAVPPRGPPPQPPGDRPYVAASVREPHSGGLQQQQQAPVQQKQAEGPASQAAQLQGPSAPAKKLTLAEEVNIRPALCPVHAGDTSVQQLQTQAPGACCVPWQVCVREQRRNSMRARSFHCAHTPAACASFLHRWLCASASGRMRSGSGSWLIRCGRNVQRSDGAKASQPYRCVCQRHNPVPVMGAVIPSQNVWTAVIGDHCSVITLCRKPTRERPSQQFDQHRRGCANSMHALTGHMEFARLQKVGCTLLAQARFGKPIRQPPGPASTAAAALPAIRGGLQRSPSEEMLYSGKSGQSSGMLELALETTRIQKLDACYLTVLHLERRKGPIPKCALIRIICVMTRFDGLCGRRRRRRGVHPGPLGLQRRRRGGGRSAGRRAGARQGRHPRRCF